MKLGELRVESEAGIIAGEPASFRVVFTCGEAILPGGRLRVLYDSRGSIGKETLGQVDDPGRANFVAADCGQGAPLRLRAYHVDHSYKPPWTEEPECFRWVDILGPDVSLNCHVVEAAFERGLGAGDTVTIRFGPGKSGYLLTRKSYDRYPIWAIVDLAGDGRWQAAGTVALGWTRGRPPAWW